MLIKWINSKYILWIRSKHRENLISQNEIKWYMHTINAQYVRDFDPHVMATILVSRNV